MWIRMNDFPNYEVNRFGGLRCTKKVEFMQQTMSGEVSMVTLDDVGVKGLDNGVYYVYSSITGMCFLYNKHRVIKENFKEE